MRPGHCVGKAGMVLYASATSCTDACELGGKRTMIRATVVKVPHVHGKLLLSMRELMDVTSADGSCGWEKLWTAWYLPGFDVFTTRDSGEVWNGPSTSSNWARENGPMYRPAANSFSTMLLYTLMRELTEL